MSRGGLFFFLYSDAPALRDERRTVVPRNDDGRQCRIKDVISPSQESKPVLCYASLGVSR
jgi:hypothetical protein